MSVKRLASLPLWLAVCGLSCPILTESVARADSATAEVLFREGRRLLLEGQTEAACAKLDESQRLDPSSGTLMNLAYCHKKLGKTASAWAEFLQAERLAAAQRNRARATEAERQAKALESELSRLTIKVASVVPGMTLSRNGDVLAPSALGVPLPLDRGRYEIRLQAPGYREWHTDVEIDAPGDRVVEVPPLEAEQAPGLVESRPRAAPKAAPTKSVDPKKPAAKRLAPARDTSHALPASFWVASAAGVAAAGVATTFGILSLSSYGQAEQACPVHDDCNKPSAIADGNRAKNQATVANIGWLVTIAAVAVAGYVYLDTPSQRAAPAPRGAPAKP